MYVSKKKSSFMSHDFLRKVKSESETLKKWHGCYFSKIIVCLVNFASIENIEILFSFNKGK